MSKALFRERTEKITKRLELVNRRYEGLEKRRNLEVQGYKTDIKILRDRLKDLERRLCKVRDYALLHYCIFIVSIEPFKEMSIVQWTLRIKK